MTNADDDLDPQLQTLEQMKNEFLVAQQRHRDRNASVSRHDDAGSAPPQAGPVAASQIVAKPGN
jgi:hypothetical protein